MEQLGSHWTNFQEILYLSIFRKSVTKIQVLLKSDTNNNNCTSHEDRYTVLITCGSVLLRLRNVSDKICSYNQNTNLYSVTFFEKSCRLWDNVEKYCRAEQATDDNTIRRMCIACWISKAIDTNSEYVIFIAFPLQQWLQERAWILRSTHIACPVITKTECVYCAVLTECVYCAVQSASLSYFRLNLVYLNLKAPHVGLRLVSNTVSAISCLKISARILSFSCR